MLPDLLGLTEMHLTNADRASLRRLIAAHPDWPAYRRLHGVDTSSLGAARALEVARHLGIDTAHITNKTEDAQTMTTIARKEQECCLTR